MVAGCHMKHLPSVLPGVVVAYLALNQQDNVRFVGEQLEFRSWD